jgi:2,3-bisphosphoglycerate-dependent phosphoglycerate mutase
MKLYFVRHGESAANILHEFSNSGLKHPLTEKGIQQAQALAHSLAGLHVEQIYSSPVLRAVQTSQILAESLHAPMQTTEALCEWSVGIYEGTTDPHGWELHRQVTEDWIFRQKLDSKMPGGESFLEIQARFCPFMDELVHTSEDPDCNLILVGHGGLYGTMLPVIFRNVDYTFASQHGMPYTTYAVAETRPDGLYCRTWFGGITL